MAKGKRRNTKAKDLSLKCTSKVNADIGQKSEQTLKTRTCKASKTKEGNVSLKHYFSLTDAVEKRDNIFLQTPITNLDKDKLPTTDSKKGIAKFTVKDGENEFHNITNGLVSFANNENVCRIAIEKDLDEAFTSIVANSHNELAAFSNFKERKSITPHKILVPSHDIKVESTSEFIDETEHKKAGPLFPIEATLEEQHADDINSDCLKSKDEKKVLFASANPTAYQNSKNNKNKKCGNNSKLTEYFTVRRSLRKTKKEVEDELLRSYEIAVLNKAENGLKVKVFEGKGRGIVTTRPFSKGEFVVEYIGDLISMSEAQSREEKYSEDDNAGCYMYYFRYNNQQLCIDATEETGRLGRLVNHSRNGNLLTKIVIVNKTPHLALVAKHDIELGEELTYDYGDRSKESLTHHPWLAY